AGDALQAGQKSHGMQFDDCTGDIRVEGCVFDDMQEPVGGGSFGDDNNGIHVENADSGTLTNLDIIDCVFRGTVVGISGTTTDHGVNIVLDEASTITNVMIEGCTATGLARSAFQVILDVDDDGDSCTITDLVITQNGDGTTPLETQADAVYIGVHGNSTLTAFRVENNTIDDGSLAAGISAGNGIHVVQGQFGVGTSSTSSATGTISDNTIANTGDSSIDVGIRIVVQEAATGTLAIRDNTVDAAADAGVHVRLFDTASADVTVSGNVLGATTANNQVTGGTIDMLVQTNQTSALCTDINTNDCNDDYRCELLGTSTFELLAIGAGTHTGAQVDTYLGNMTQANVGPTDSLPAGTAVFTECATVATP
ncbi:MAG: right-handed parallel beta-helix repeat-containing protein, partial [Planctomycetota bacterium]|nr:right-handed parallel beta-helix repeat-containing protein [Planctomycetota bacterium]